VWLHDEVSAGTPTGSPDPVIQRMTSLPLALVWESFTLPVWIITRFRADWPSVNNISSRAKVRARAHEAIFRHSFSVRPVKSAEAHIITMRSAMLDSLVDVAPEVQLAVAIDPSAIARSDVIFAP
jgi:hypothetical protein